MKLWINTVLLICMSLILWGCDDTEKQIIQQSDHSQNKTIVEFDDTANKNNVEDFNLEPLTATVSENKEFMPEEVLLNDYKNRPLSILDSSEVVLDGVSTLVVTFSVPLKPTQNFNQFVSLVEDGKGKVDGNWELSSNGLELRHRYLVPNCKLTLHVDKSIVAINDQSLKSVYQANIVTRNRSPMVGFSSNGSLLPSQSMKGLPVTTLNIDQVDVNFFRIKTDKFYDFMKNYGAEKQLPVWSAEQALSYADLVYSARFNLSPKLNVQENKIIDLSSIHELKAEGTYIAVLNQSGQYKYSNPMTIFSISNIGISVHGYQNGKLSIFAHRLDDGRALANIKLTALCGKKSDKCHVITAQTDRQGYAELKTNNDDQYQVLTASDGEQMSFVYIARDALDLSEFNVLGNHFYQKQLFTFAARDLYRPGETIYLNALLRDADGQRLPEQPIKTEIISPTGQTVKNFVWQTVTPKSGFYQTEFVIPTNAATGKWTAKFNLGDDIYRYYYFSVEEFLPERIAVTLIPPSDKPILKNQNTNFIIKGWYLYGAPASDNQLETNIAMVSERSLAQLPGFYIGSITESNLDRKIDTLEQTLDSQGIAQINIDKQNWHEIKSPIKILLQASVLDVGGRPVQRMITQSIWPANEIPAIRPLFAESRYYDWSIGEYVMTPTVDIGSRADFEVAYIDQVGNKQSSEQLLVRFVKERRDYYWTWSDSEGWQTQYDQKEFVLSEQHVNVTIDGVAKIGFLPDDYGSYRIEVIDLSNNVMSSMRFWNGYPWIDNTERSGAVRPDQVKLTLDKGAYKAGDTAKIHVEAPESGSGYLSLETNDGTLWVKKINVPLGGIDVDVPIKDWGRFDIYISATIIRPSSDSTTQTIKRAVGLLYLPIDTSQRQLKLTFDVADKTYPEKNVKVKVKVKVADAQVKNSDITLLLSAVDNGVLNITNFVTPDPYSAFLGRKRYDVEQFDVYGKLIEGNGKLIGISFGGDSDMMLNQNILSGGKKPLTEINIVAQQLQTIRLNSRGEGEIELPVPNFNGELRLMAQVWDNNRFGSAEKVITVSAPVIAELSPPRFLSGGDQTMIALELRNLTDVTQNINLDLSTDGLIAVLNTQKVQQVTLKPQEQKILTIPAVANYGFGQGRITINISNIKLFDGQDYQLSSSWMIGVRPPYHATSRISSAALNGGEGWTLSPLVLTDLIDNTIEAEMVFSHHPPFNIAKYIKSLNNYQYGCLEQTISRLYPSLYANQEQLQNLGIQSGTDEERRKYVQSEIDRIFGMQRINGSFGLWNKESTEEYWLTVYTVDFLLRAKERGYQVNEQGLNKALERLSQYLYEPSAFYNMMGQYGNDIEDYIEFSTKCYAALILAKQQNIMPAMRNELKRLYQQVKGNSVLVSPLPIMQLSIVSQLTGNSRTSKDLFDIALSTTRDSQYYWLGDYGSTIRDQAQIYNLMVEYQMAEDMQANYLLNLSNELKNEAYFSTQELSALFIMSWDNMQKQDAQNLVVLLNNKNRLTSKTTIYQTMDYQRLSNGISIHNPHNAAPLYIQFALSGYAKKMPPPTPDDSILTISRRYFDSNGQPISANQLKAGDRVIVMLNVSADRIIHDALVVDMLPAGLELENPNLSNNRIDISVLPELSALLKNGNNIDIKYQEFRDDRYVAAINISNGIAKNRYSTKLIYVARAVTPGQYVVPAPYVESMYKSEWYAIGHSIDSMNITAQKK